MITDFCMPSCATCGGDTVLRCPACGSQSGVQYDDPVNRIVWRPASALKANDYNPNMVFTPELRLLERSILKTGWTQPCLINGNDIIIDGFHRRMLAMESPELLAKYNGQVPCAVMDVDDARAMILTVRMNRAKGSHAAVRMSVIVKKLIDQHHYDRAEVAAEIGATLDEIDLLYQDSIFKAKNMKDYRYSKAWVPVEDGKKNEV